ncbi:MAG: ABC transporter permease, partial [Clostridiales bacterium]|nr:ABC transporter permease [Clostridiales bacterium]
MLRKLAIRNAKRSIKDYLVYLITVIMSFSLIIAFNLIVYSKDVRELSSTMMNFRLAVIEVSVLVVFVIGWLINYTMKFMLSKRSKEFGTYMILGIERKDIIKMFLIENIFLGIFAFVVSIFIGYILSDLLTAVIMNIFEVQYKLNFSISWQPFALSILYFIIIYLFVMFRINRRMKKMKVYDLLYLDKQNEERVFKNSKKKKILFVVFFIIGITSLTLFKKGLYHVGDNGSIPMIVGGVPLLIISIYGITITVGDFIIDFVINRKKIKYKNDNLFITRQFTSKIKTMGMTLGTLSLLITLSFLSLSGSMMYTDMFNAQINSIAAYDVMISEV